MNLSLIQEGEELEKKAQSGPWKRTDMGLRQTNRLKQEGWPVEDSETNLALIAYLRTHAKELLEAARWAVGNGYKGV